MTAQQKIRDLTEDEIAQALSYLSPHNRDTWVKMSFAIKSELGDDGFDIWDNWSRQSDDYEERAARHVWKSGKVGGSVTIATLVWEAQQGGFKLEAPEAAKLDEEQAEERKRVRAEARAKSAKEERERKAAALIQAEAIWSAATPADLHPYLSKKQVKSHGLRVGQWPLRKKTGEVYGMADNVLLIPIRNAKGQLTSLQGVYDKMPSGYTQGKTYLKDGEKSGSWFMIGQITEGCKIALCEGYATGATIHELTGWTVLVCFDRTNLLTVAEQVRPNTPGIEIVICADNDQFGKTNDGVIDAKRAGNAIGAKVLVPNFASLEGEPTDFNDLFTREGASETLSELGFTQPKPKAPEAANDNDPFYPLGYDRGFYFYLVTGTKQLCKLSASQHSKAHMMQLAPLDYWNTEYPAKSGPAWDVAADELMRACEDRGVFSPDVIRGRGAWLDDGRTVFHFGSHLWVDGTEMAVTRIRSKYVYEMDRSISSPSGKELSDTDGQMLVDIAKQFRWSKPASAALLAGFVALAPLCGALKWRPHCWITGGAGCGKTTVLNDFVHYLQGGKDIFAQGNSTEAGIRQTLGSDALPVLFDESEQNNDREVGRVQNVLSLIRQASTESAAKTLKGTAGGDAMHFITRSMFCLSSIQVGMKHQADLERLTVLALRPKREDTDAAENWDKLKDQLHLIHRDSELPARLFTRSLNLLPTTLKNISTFVDAASRKFGSVREGDQYGTLLAGCWSLMNSRLATPAEATALIESFEWDEFRENIEVDESTKALGALLEAQIRIGGGTGSATVYEIVRASTGAATAGVSLTQPDAEATLQRYGMRVVNDDLLLSNNSHSLVELLHGTPYGADWRGQLLRVPGVRRHDKAVRFNGQASKCVAVPLGSIMDRRREGAPF